MDQNNTPSVISEHEVRQAAEAHLLMWSPHAYEAFLAEPISMAQAYEGLRSPRKTFPTIDGRLKVEFAVERQRYYAVVVRDTVGVLWVVTVSVMTTEWQIQKDGLMSIGEMLRKKSA